MFCDLAAVVTAFMIALAISSGSFTWPSFAHFLAVRIQVLNLFIVIAYLVFCIVVFSLHGFYGAGRLLPWKQRLWRILLAVSFAAGAVLALRAMFDFDFATDGFVVSFWAVSCCVLVLAHETSRALQSIARLHGKYARNVIIVGEGRRAQNLAAYLKQQTAPGYRLLRIISTKEPKL
jgi:putative colanic acid biosynthesis UDP-glucose lipid carrier transferase